jgi:hypothetical protein
LKQGRLNHGTAMPGLSVAHATEWNINLERDGSWSNQSVRAFGSPLPMGEVNFRCRSKPMKRVSSKISCAMSTNAQQNGTRSSMVVPSPRPAPRQSSVTESVVLPPVPRGASCPKSKSNRPNAGSAKGRQTGHPAHRARSSACTNFPAAPGVPTQTERNPSRVRRQIQ